MRADRIFAALAVAALFTAAQPLAEPIVTRHPEGTSHGLLALRMLDGTLLASGEQTEVLRGGHVTLHLVFRFKDGSVDEERTIFSQRGDLRLITYHLVQKGPSFPHPIDMTIDARSGEVVVRYINDHGESKIEAERLDLPPDVSNGMMNTVLKNVKADALPVTVSYVAATPKPRLV